MKSVDASASSDETELDAPLREQLTSLREEGREIWNRFDVEVRQHTWHTFVPADYQEVQRALLALREPGLRFLEWGSATGVITIMADLLGFEAYGIELDSELNAIARDLASRYGSEARFATGSYLPAGYEWKSATGDPRLGTIGDGPSGYEDLQHPLEDFDVIFAYPWTGAAPVMHDLIQRRGGTGARLLLYGSQGVQVHRRDQRASSHPV